MKAAWQVQTSENGNVEIREIDSGNRYTIYEEESGRYYNRKIRTIKGIKGEAYLVDGYSSFAYGILPMEENLGQLTVDVWIAPRSFELAPSAIISCGDQEQKEGFILSVGKFGRVYFEVGIGEEWVVADTKTVGVIIGRWNHLTATFDGTAGWLSIYINGLICGRKQFKRQSQIKTTKQSCFLGKRNNAKTIADIFSFQVFDGYVDGLYLTDICQKQIDVVSKHFVECSNLHEPQFVVTKELLALEPLDYAEDRNRPRYHMMAPGHWMNEPHAPVYFSGFYHLFYQANPHAPVWDHIQWGHVISKDMVHWEHLPLALVIENNGLDPDGCWSGSCCKDANGIPVIFYTAGNEDTCPNQAVAIARSGFPRDGDITLTKWEKEKTPILCQEPHMGWYGEFRDPFVWRERDKYYMLVGTGDGENKGGNAALFDSRNMVNWEYRGLFTEYAYEDCEEVGHVWELPVFLPLKDEQGNTQKWILLFCACQIEAEVVEVYYLTGDWDGDRGSFIKDMSCPKLLDYGYGTFTGPSGFVTEDGRSVLFTIAQGKRSLKEEVDSGWAHNGGLPIELFFTEEQTLGIRPIKELASIRKECLIDKEDCTITQANEMLLDICLDQMELVVHIRKEQVLIFNFGEHTYKMIYDQVKGLLIVDQAGNLISKSKGNHRCILAEEVTRLHIFVDASMLEIYVNEKASFTLRNYVQVGERRFLLEGEGSEKIGVLQLWKLFCSK